MVRCCKNCALKGADWCRCNEFIIPRNSRGECEDWEPNNLFTEFMIGREGTPYKGKHLIKKTKPLKELPSIGVFYETDY